MEPAQGDRVAHFVLRERLGAGGMGVVHRATDDALDRDVALKLILGAYAAEPEYRARLLREARAAAAISHPGLPTVYEVGEDGGLLYIAMELLDGRTLRDALPAVTPARALALGAEIADALAAAHAAGVVHRDVKPENVFLTRDGRVKLLDFGLARRPAREVVADAPTEAVTSAGAMLGTPGYMAPEQADGQPVGPASDVFSLGVVLYELLAHERPFEGTSGLGLVIAVARDPHRPLRERLRVPEALGALIDTCLAKDPAERTLGAREVAERLREIAASGALDAARATPQIIEPSPAPATPRRRGAWLPVAGALVLAAGAFAVSRGVRSPPPAPLPSGTPSAETSASAPPPTSLEDLPVPTTNDAALAAYRGALSALRRSDWGRARALLREATQKDPALVVARLRLAHVEGVMGDLAEGRRGLRWVAEREAQLSERDRAWLRGVEALHMPEPPDYALAARRFGEASGRWPGDAELLYMQGAALERSGHADEALAVLARTLALDPAYADALQLVARVHALRGDAGPAATYLDRCVEARSVDCLFDRIRAHLAAGRCADVVRDAKLADARGARGSQHWVHAASAVVSQGEPVDAARPFLDLADRGADDPWNHAYARASRLRFRALAGDFTGVERQVEELGAGATDLGELASLAELAVQARLEHGADPVPAAQAFLAKRSVAGVGFQALPVSDPAPLFWALVSRAGKLDPADAEARIEGWRRAQRGTYDEGQIWFQSAALPAEDRDQAAKALASRPASFSLPRVQAWHLGWDTLAKLEALTGRPAEALPLLRRAAASCAALTHPFAWVRAQAALGEALEATDPAESCRAYRVVVRHWGKAKPKSKTAERAAARLTALACPKAP